MLFEIHAEKSANDKKVFFYDNQRNVLTNEDGNEIKYADVSFTAPEPYVPFSKELPLTKSNEIQTLKIQLGLGCNYSCDYCSQKFVERGDATNPRDIADFLEKLNALEFDEAKGLRVEFWGGEPLVYFKTLKPLAEAIRERFKDWKVKPRFSMVTNGSILTDDIIDWLMKLDFSVAISHDALGQAVRGADPFDDKETKDRILGFRRMQTRLKKGFSFNAMLSRNNQSRKAIYDWFVNLTGDENVVLGEGGIVDAYDEDGITNSLQTKAEHFKFRQTAVRDILVTGGKIGFTMVLGKIDDFVKTVLMQVPADYLGQKCGMDDKHTLAVDLKGNVLTCQNVSSVEISKNGESHLGGNLDNYSEVALTTSTHWSKRDECPSCPVLHLCKGACMFLDNKYWQTSCANAYSDNVALFSLGIKQITGYIPTLIKNDALPLDRQDIFGTIYEHQEVAPKKVIPIKVINEVVEIIDNVEIYGKSRVVA